ncbi:hypothetical protein LIER_32931 [Lithospermum erythrorhizon]|uniref:DUF4283 domain-containing protein n=1 Tax=Lithospermum erythrorhizon TaxID=34254 RepID=A0AAV3RVA9_LITER
MWYLSLEGEELEEVFVPEVAYDKVEEKFQFSLIGKVLTNKTFHRWEAEMLVDQFSFETIPCWVQVWNLPLGYVNMIMGQAVGAHIKKVMEVDRRSIEYEKLCDVCLYCGMLGHEYYNCDGKFNDTTHRVIKDNKYDSWFLVHRER